MRKTLKYALAEIFDVEAGYQRQAADRGNWYKGRLIGTNRGITPATLAAWTGETPTIASVKAITASTARKILEGRYATTIRYNDLPAGLDFALLDFAVNSGPSRAVKELQQVLGVKTDGLMGGITLKVIARHDVLSLIRKLGEERLRFMKNLSNWWKYGKGWSIRVRKVTDLARTLALTTGP